MQSSAKSLMLHEILSVISLIKTRNNKGPKTEPCGTPDVTGRVSDGTCSCRTYWERSVKKSLIQCVNIPSPIVLWSFAIAAKPVLAR